MDDARIVADVVRADAAVIAGLESAGVATVHEAGSAALLDPAISPIQAGARIAGSAITVSCPPGDNLMLHAAVEHVGEGDVLVVTTTAPAPNGMFGELLAVSVTARGCRGLVIDGGVRDVAELRAMGFPVWARFVHALGTTKTGAGSVNVPVRIAGAEVNVGDVIVADDDGVAVVERHRAAEVLEASRRRLTREDETRRRLSAGELGLDLYGMRDRLADLGVRPVNGSEG